MGDDLKAYGCLAIPALLAFAALMFVAGCSFHAGWNYAVAP